MVRICCNCERRSPSCTTANCLPESFFCSTLLCCTISSAASPSLHQEDHALFSSPPSPLTCGYHGINNVFVIL
ncbi:hypothetical protein AHAS_Ahas15G0271000 [Arachis hypogaea]